MSMSGGHANAANLGAAGRNLYEIYISGTFRPPRIYRPTRISLLSENGGSHAGCNFPLRGTGVFRRRHRLHPDLREAVMGADYILAAFVTLGVLGYLIYALIRPEKF